MWLFYCPDIQTDMELPQEEAGHCIRVLRMKEGDQIRLTDGKGAFYDAVISAVSGKRCMVHVTKTEKQSPLWSGYLHIAVAPTKLMDRNEWFVEKAVEIGVDEITFLKTDHSERDVIKMERIEKIAVSAMKQSQKANLGHFRLRQGGGDGEAVADGLDSVDAEGLQAERRKGHQDDGGQRAGNATAQFRHEYDNEDAAQTHQQRPPIDCVDVLGIDAPLAQEVGRNAVNLQTEEVLDLRGEDGQRDTGGKTDHDRVGDIFDDGAQVQDAHQDQECAGHEGRDHQAVHAVFLDDSEDNDDEGAGGAADLDLAAAEEGNEESRHDGGQDAGLRSGTGRDAERDGQRQGHDADDDTCQQVLDKLLLVVTVLERREQFGLETNFEIHVENSSAPARCRRSINTLF